jgi:hypothetical protein
VGEVDPVVEGLAELDDPEDEQQEEWQNQCHLDDRLTALVCSARMPPADPIGHFNPVPLPTRFRNLGSMQEALDSA